MKRRLLFLILASFACIPLFAQFNWQHTNGPDGGALGSLFSNDSFAFYPDNYYLYRTVDGLAWEKLPYGGISPLATHGATLVGQKASDLFVNGVESLKLMVSHDNGDTWADGAMPPGMERFYDLAVCSHGIYVPDGFHDLLFRSQDDGLTWDTIVPPVDNCYDIWSFEERLYLTNRRQVFRTDAGGAGWTECTPLMAAPEYVQTLIAYGQHLLVATDRKLWHSHDDGATWAFQSTPWPTSFKSLTRAGDVIFGLGGATDMAKSMDFGQSWTALSSAPEYPSPSEIVTVHDIVLGSSYDRGVFRWDDPAQRFFEANNGLSSARISKLVGGGNKIWAYTGRGLFDYDKSTHIWNPAPRFPSFSQYYSSLVANDGNLVCFGDYDASFFWLSSDAGAIWDSIPMPADQFGWPYSLQSIKVFDDAIFIWGDGRPFRSDDHGQTWQALPLQITDIVKFNNLCLTLFGGWVMASSDQGMTWVNYAAIPDATIWSLNAGGDRLFAFATVLTGNTYRRAVYVSEDGLTWKYAHDGLPDLNFSYDFDTNEGCDFFGYGGKYFVYHSAAGFYESLDTCRTWVPLERRPYHAVTLSDSTFYAGGFGGGVIRAGVPDLFSAIATGVVYRDDDNDGIHDAGESPIPGVAVSLEAPAAWSPFYLTNTNTDGAYSLAVTPGAGDTLRPLIHSNYLESINPPWYLVGNGGANLNFGVKLMQNIHDLSVAGNYVGRPRPGFECRIAVHFNNEGTVTQDAVLSLKLDPNLHFIQAYPPPAEVWGDSLVWSAPALSVFGSGDILVQTMVPAATALGTVVTSVGRIASPATDLTPANNLRILTDTVVGSYDPNEKRVEPAKGLTAAEIAAGKELLYTIQFQNTGSAEADRVRITDMLDAALDWPSLRLVSASHSVSSFRLLPGGLLEIVFDHILLPGSSADEAASHGYVTFGIQRNKTFGPQDVVRNTAAIYFDSNEPVLTNQVTTPVISESVSVNDPAGETTKGLHVYPNPADIAFTVLPGDWKPGSGWLTLQNMAGQVCLHRRITDLSQPVLVQTGGLPAGVYVVRISGNEKTMTGSVVVQRRD